MITPAMTRSIAKILVKGGRFGKLKTKRPQNSSIMGIAKVRGVSAPYGSELAKSQFARIEAQASKTGMYGGKSLAWGAGGRSRLLYDRLIVAGKTESQAKEIVKINYFRKRPLHM